MKYGNYRVVGALIILLGLVIMAPSSAFSEPLPLPSQGSELFIPYAPVAAPYTADADVTYIKPLGLGNLAMGTFSPYVTIDFSGVSDLYIGLNTTVAPDQWYLLWEDGTFHDLNEGIRPWRERVMGINNNWLFDDDIPLSALQSSPGTFNFYLMAVPHGADLQTAFPYYLWETSFVVAPDSLSLSATNIDFGSTSAPTSQDLILTNSSGNPYTISISLHDSTGVFSITANTCTAILAPQQSCAVTVSVNPGAVVPGGIEFVGVDISIVPEAALSAAAADESPVRLTIPVIARPVEATPCVYTVGNPVPSSFVTSGGSGTISVSAAPAGCSGTWTAVSNNTDWITVASGGSGTGIGTISFNVAGGYTGAAPRTGAITVNGSAKTITQAPETVTDCSKPILNPTSRTAGASSTTGSIQLSTGAGCAWTASGFFLSPWLRVTSAQSGTGSATITYAVDAYTGSGSRIGSLYVAGKTFTLTQTGSGCSYTLSPSSVTLGSRAGNGQFQVALSSTCLSGSPSLSVNESWIHVATSTKTSSGYTIGFTVDANTSGATRSGTIVVAGTKEFTVNQSTSDTVTPAGCTISLSKASENFTTTGGQGNFVVTATGTNCSWTATSSDSTWLTVNSPAGAQTGGATVTYTVAANGVTNAPARSGSITIGDKSFYVSQDGVAPATDLRYESFEGQWNKPKYFNFVAVAATGSLPAKGRPYKFLKITVPPEGCPTNRVEFWLSGMTQNGNMLLASPDDEFGSFENAWAVYEQKLALGQGAHQEGPDYWFGFNTLSSNEAHIIMNASQYNGRTFYIMLVNEGPKGTTYRVGAYCN